MQPLPDEARVYMERAQQGLNRLAYILTRMTEATRLEHSLADAERERFDLAHVVAGCVDGYRAAYPQQTLELSLPSGPVPFDGAPELIAQMLDKLVANAVEFAAPGTPITVALERDGLGIRLSVANQGPPLPLRMHGRLFDSMVSVRTEQSRDEPHLGLGLYIVRLIAEFHGGRASALNRADAAGVIVSVVLPLVRAVR
jgi:signal transduction histidine kinase